LRAVTARFDVFGGRREAELAEPGAVAATVPGAAGCDHAQSP